MLAKRRSTVDTGKREQDKKDKEKDAGKRADVPKRRGAASGGGADVQPSIVDRLKEEQRRQDQAIKDQVDEMR